MSKNKGAGGIESMLNSYNEMQLEEIDTATATLAFTLATYYKHLIGLEIDVDTVRFLCLGFQQTLLGNIKTGDK